MKSFKYILLLFGLLLVSNLLAERVEKEKITISNDLVVASNTTLGGNVTIGNEMRTNWPIELTNTTTIIYVDSNRTNSYNENGSITYPYKTIMGAINKVIANGDNSWENQREYVIDVMGGFYYENLILENTNLVYLAIKSEGLSLLYPPSGNALQSTTNNSNLYVFSMKGFMVYGPVVITGNSTMTTFVPYFIDCDFYLGIYLTCVAAADFSGRAAIVGGDFSAINCGVVSIGFTLGAGGTSYSCSYNTNLPYMAGIYPSLIFESPTETPSIYCGTNAEVQFRAGSRVVAPGNTLTIDGTVINYGGLVRGNIVVNSNGTFNTYGGWYNRSTLTINPGGTVNDYNTSGSGGATNQVIAFSGKIYTITNDPVSNGDSLWFNPVNSNAWFGGSYLKLITITNDSDQTNDLVVTGVGFTPNSVRIFTPGATDPDTSQNQILAYKDGIYILDNTWSTNNWQFMTGESAGEVAMSLKSWDTDGITLSREVFYMDATNSLTYRFIFYR
jgi:hypothetical protein